jgi:uncharacterized Zn finger protein
MAKKRSHRDTYAERIAEYTDSPRLKQRIRVGKTISCMVDGNYGRYQTRVVLERSGKGKEAECSCPSEYWPCKHASALILTYRKSPDSFLDVDMLLDGLKQKGRDELLKLIQKMIAVSPACLKALGVKEFEQEENEEEEPYEESW